MILGGTSKRSYQPPSSDHLEVGAARPERPRVAELPRVERSPRGALGARAVGRDVALAHDRGAARAVERDRGDEAVGVERVAHLRAPSCVSFTPVVEGGDALYATRPLRVAHLRAISYDISSSGVEGGNALCGIVHYGC